MLAIHFESMQTWKLVPGRMKDIDCGSHGTVYAISVDGTLMFNDPAGSCFSETKTISIRYTEEFLR